MSVVIDEVFNYRHSMMIKHALQVLITLLHQNHILSDVDKKALLDIMDLNKQYGDE